MKGAGGKGKRKGLGPSLVAKAKVALAVHYPSYGSTMARATHTICGVVIGPRTLLTMDDGKLTCDECVKRF